LSENIYEQLLTAVPQLPLENIVLATAFGKHSNRIRWQALIEFTVGKDLFEGVFMTMPQLANEAIIGCQLLKEYGISLNFSKESFKSFSYAREGELREHLFSQWSGLQKVASNDRSLAQILSVNIQPPEANDLIPDQLIVTLRFSPHSRES
jgi:hypothetical protein